MTSNRTKQIGADNKLADCITSYAKLINDLAKYIELKGSTKRLINGKKAILMLIISSCQFWSISVAWWECYKNVFSIH